MKTLEHIPEFKNAPDLRDKLMSYGSLKKFREGETVINQHSIVRTMPIVMKGSMRVMRTDKEGHELLIYYIKPGETCIMSFLGGIHHGTSKIDAIAEEETEVLFIPVDKMPVLMKEYKEWHAYIFRIYHKRFEELLDMVNAVAFKKLDDRILHLLQEKKKITGNSTIVVTHQQLAEELGTARVVVSRLLKQMETERLLELGRNKISLV